MKRNATRIIICALFALFYLVATVPSVRSYPPFLRKAKELGLPANDCAYCHVNASGGQPLGDRAKWLVEEKTKRNASAIDIAWLKEYSGEPVEKSQPQPASPAGVGQGSAPDAATATTNNTSGVWKMNAAKSKFDGGGGPQEMTLKFDQQGQNLSESLIMKGPEGERTIEMKYTLDGKEGDNQLGDRAVKSTALWEGDVLVIDVKTSEGHFRRKFTFSEGGKVMTVAVNRTESDGEKTDTVVLEKQ